MSRHATDWAWETDPGSSSLKLILLSMADRADEYNLCYPSIERLVKDTCLNKKTVQAGLISLMKMGLISDTGERKGATKRVRVFSLNITKNGNIKGNPEGGNEPENGNVTENGNIPKNGMLNDPKNGMLNDPKNGIQNQSYNQSFNQERESRTKSGDSVPHDPGANNAVMNNFVSPGGPGQLGKFVMHEQWQPSDDFLRKSSLQGSTWTVCQRHRNLQSSEFTGWLRVRHTIRHSGSRSWQGGCRLADRSNQHYLITTFRTGTALKRGRISCEQRFYRDTKP